MKRILLAIVLAFAPLLTNCRRQGGSGGVDWSRPALRPTSLPTSTPQPTMTPQPTVG